jgi:mRNA interferase MazF
VWLQFHPQAGHEHRGRRPALVLSPAAYNRKVGLALCCPVTTRVKGYPFEVELLEHEPAQGAVLCDQVKSLDWRAREASRIGKVSDHVLDEATAKILTLIDPQ